MCSSQPNPSSTRRRRDGFHLAEAVICTALVGLVLVGAMDLVGASLRSRTWQAQRRQGSALARDLITEILQARYEEPDDPPVFGKESGEEATGNRSLWDDLDDYEGWSSAPEAKDGVPLVNYDSWTRQVEVRYVDPGNPGGSGSTAPGDDLGLKRITVTVTDPQGNQTTLVGLRFESSGYEQEPVGGATLVQQVGIELQIGPDTKARYKSAAHVLDQAPAD